MTRLVTVLLLLVLPLVFSPALALADSGGILIDGKHAQLVSAPTVVGGVVMLPVRDVVEALGGKVFWEAGAHKAVLQTREHRVELVPGQATVRIDSQQVPLSAPVTLQGGRMLAPASFLLALYGDRLQIHDPRLIAAAAVALLGQVQIPVNFDFAVRMKVTTQMIGTFPVMRSMPDGRPSPSVPTSTEVGGSVEGFVRGQNALITMTDTEPTPIRAEASRSRIALRDGHAYAWFDGKWEQLPEGPGTFPPLDASAVLPVLLKSLREAHLGPARVVEGHKLQDVAVTLDPSALDRAVAGQQAPSAAPPPAAVAPDTSGTVAAPAVPRPGSLYQSMGCTITLDAETHELRGFTVDMVLVTKDQVEGHEIGMHMVMHVTGMLAPDATPIVWPRDLP